ncbi:MAG: GvpL/GvpF family gas vesicle protein [Candidatus Zhuqueibacterota bacterium]
MSENGKYIYCIIEEEKSQTFGSRNIGETPAPVHSIHFNHIGAVISDTPIVNYPLLSKNYLAHQKVIEEALSRNLNPLPVRFATIARNEQNIMAILEKRYDEFQDYLDRLRGKRELGLKVFWDSDIAYNEILNENNQIKKLRDSLLTLPQEKSYFQRIEVGKLVENALIEKRKRESERILSPLRELCIDYRLGNIIGDKMVVNASFLVDSDQEKLFDAWVGALNEENLKRFIIKYVGPIPPYNFVEIDINILELGLN